MRDDKKRTKGAKEKELKRAMAEAGSSSRQLSARGCSALARMQARRAIAAGRLVGGKGGGAGAPTGGQGRCRWGLNMGKEIKLAICSKNLNRMKGVLRGDPEFATIYD